MNCKVCGREMILDVLHNHSGWYIGYVCDTCGPQTRETGYYAPLNVALDNKEE